LLLASSIFTGLIALIHDSLPKLLLRQTLPRLLGSLAPGQLEALLDLRVSHGGSQRRTTALEGLLFMTHALLRLLRALLASLRLDGTLYLVELSHIPSERLLRILQTTVDPETATTLALLTRQSRLEFGTGTSDRIGIGPGPGGVSSGGSLRRQHRGRRLCACQRHRAEHEAKK
jgi:hypothetical protein